MQSDRKPRSLIDSFRNRSGHSPHPGPLSDVLPRNVIQQFNALKESVSKLQDENEALKLQLKNLQTLVADISAKLQAVEERLDTPKPTLWERLKVSLLNRPPIDVLKNQKIYKNEPCFNTELQNVPMDPATGVPQIVVLCCFLIEKHLMEYNTQVNDSEEDIMEAAKIISGIYRAPGDCVEIQKLRFKINDNRYDCLEYERNVNTIASLLKLFFFELKTPLLRDIDFLKSLDVNPHIFGTLTMDGKVSALKNFIEQIPEENFRTLKHFILHLTRLTFTYSDLITSKGLSISIGPSIIRIERHFENLDHRAEHFSIMNNYLDYLIQYSDYIFPQMAIISTEV
ncbi:unnamed protein product [Hermetia illucens]|uniref:Rho-GAP domain-containing protein n=1 Tax=Hermetia illucens TaxID=343691 RepID=A0A7R8UUZ1_HERIL|nr:rho GTPase-activating protein 15-like [Hermetia illucens]CAD7087417.1 unnamed protein product [Hermetia illucens]